MNDQLIVGRQTGMDGQYIVVKQYVVAKQYVVNWRGTWWWRYDIFKGFAAVAALAGGVLFAGRANADDGLHDIAITISPLHLFSPIVEVTGEVKVAPKLGFAALVGVGSIEAELEDSLGETTTERFSAWEVGASGRFYALGNFDHGMQLGVEALYVNVDLEEGAVEGTGTGLALGPFIGYKVTADSGFTFDSQLGFQYIAVQGETSSGDRANDTAVIPLLNLNIGWAF